MINSESGEPSGIASPLAQLIVAKGSRGSNVGKVEWVIDGFLAKGATTLLAAEAGAGKTSLLMHAAVSVEYGIPFLDQAATRQGSVLFIQGDEPQCDSEKKQRLMGISGAVDFVYIKGTLDLRLVEEASGIYQFIVIDSATSLLAHEGSYHEDPAFTTKLYKLGEIISESRSSCIITSHLRKSADGAPRKDLTTEDIAGRATIRNALQDYWGLMRSPEPRWDDHYILKCFGKRHCRMGEQWELQGDPESYWWGLQETNDGLPPKQRRALEEKLLQWFKLNPEPRSAKELSEVTGMNYEHVRRCCVALFAQNKLDRRKQNPGAIGRPCFAYFVTQDFSYIPPPGRRSANHEKAEDK